MTTGAPSETSGSPDRALRKLFLTLFLRGRSARGLSRSNAPKSLSAKLWMSVTAYTFIGLMFGFLRHGPVFTHSLYLHGMTLLLCGMFIAASSGETLFNKEEADILLHRPITPQALLRAKMIVLLQVSLCIAGAFNLVGTFSGLAASDATFLYPVAHAVSTVLEAVFCTGCVVLGYEFCLRCFGRERLESVMTTAQVLMAVGAVLASQLVPRVIVRIDLSGNPYGNAWWLSLLPPAWFASFDSALAGSGGEKSWTLAAVGVGLTVIVVWLALGKMARHYETGLQLLGEATAAPRATQTSRRWLASLVHLPPLSWLLRDPVSRASFLLVTHYLMRDRDVKLRIYPSVVPMLVLPVIVLLPIQGGGTGMGVFGVAFAAGYMSLVPFLAVTLLKYSQQWQASDVFRVAPIPGPAPLCAGVRLAVSCFLTLPLMLGLGVIVWFLHKSSTPLPLLLPGLLMLPIFTLYPHLGGDALPLSQAGDEARSAQRGLQMFFVTFASVILSGIATWAWITGWFRWFLLGEAIMVAVTVTMMRASLATVRWDTIE